MQHYSFACGSTTELFTYLIELNKKRCPFTKSHFSKNLEKGVRMFCFRTPVCHFQTKADFFHQKHQETTSILDKNILTTKIHKITSPNPVPKSKMSSVTSTTALGFQRNFHTSDCFILSSSNLSVPVGSPAHQGC